MSLFTPHIKNIDNYYDKGRYLLAWRISLSFSIIFLILSFIYSLSNVAAALPTTLTLLVTISSAAYLKVTKNFRPLFWIYAISGTLLANFAMNYVLDFTHYVDFVWITACIILVFIGLGTRYGVLFIIINCIGIAYFFWFTLNTHIEVLQPKTNLELVADFVEMAFAFFVVAYLLLQFVHFQKYSEKELLKANKDLEKQNKLILSKNSENETLLKEIHHRVKNNLQIVISLLRMQSAEMKSEESKKHFSEAINRIMAMSLIHQKLYGEKELSKIDLKSYIEELVTDIIEVSLELKNVELTIETDTHDLSLDTIVPLGLLINELVSNSLKHAFSGGKGNISIQINQKKEAIKFTYKDNGVWKAPVQGKISFGVELIEILTDQMDGDRTLDTTNGTQYIFNLKNL